MKDNVQIYRGEIYFANLDPVEGSEQGGRRPVIILQNDIGNRYAPTTIVAPITSRTKRHRYPTHVNIEHVAGLANISVIMLEQMRTISKARLEFKIGKLSCKTMEKVDKAIYLSLGLDHAAYL